MSELDADALALLTPEERAAVTDTEYSENELASIGKIAGEDAEDDLDDDADDDNDAGNDAGDDAPGSSEPGADTTTAKEADEPAKDTSTTDQVVAPEAFVPRYESALPTDHADQVKSLATQEAQLKQQFKDGDIDFDAYEEMREAILTQREALTIQRAKAEISSEMNEQSSAQLWQTTVNRFFATAAKDEAGIDYNKDLEKQAELDLFVKALAGKESNSDKSMEWFLTEAHKRVLSMNDIKPVKRESIAEANKRRAPPIDAAPKTLAQVPGGDGPGDVESEFSKLDSLDGDDLEAAIARMSPALRERYARAG